MAITLPEKDRLDTIKPKPIGLGALPSKQSGSGQRLGPLGESAPFVRSFDELGAKTEGNDRTQAPSSGRGFADLAPVESPLTDHQKRMADSLTHTTQSKPRLQSGLAGLAGRSDPRLDSTAGFMDPEERRKIEAQVALENQQRRAGVLPASKEKPDAGTAITQESRDLKKSVKQGLQDVEARVEAASDSVQALGPRLPENDDPLAKDFLAVNSRATNRGELDINNTQEVPGLDGVGYAGRYGETDVFVGQGDQGQRSFSDLPNLAATRGGNPAAAPDGRNVISNNDLLSLPSRQGRDSLAQLQSAPTSSEALWKARKAAAERGDWDAVERSYMSPEEREQADRQAELDKLRNQLLKTNPELVYKAEIQAQRSGRGLDPMDLYRIQRDAQSDARAVRNDRREEKRQQMKDSEERTEDVLGLLGFKDIAPDQITLGQVGKTITDNPDWTASQVADFILRSRELSDEQDSHSALMSG